MNLLEINIDKLFSILKTDPEKGLSNEQVLKNRAEFGSNVLTFKPKTIKEIFKAIFGDVMVLLYIALCIFALAWSKDRLSLSALAAMVAAYLVFQFFSYAYLRKVTNKVDKYRRLKCRVKRQGHIITVDSENLVPGDILLLSKGDIVPCDGIILKQKTLRVLEASITGRREPIIKRSHSEVESESGYPYFECILFGGTVIISGSATVFVCNTGKNIFDNGNQALKKQSGMLPKICKTALFLRKQLSLIWIIVSFFIFAMGIFLRQDIFIMFFCATSLAVAAVPDCIDTFNELALAITIDRLYSKQCVLKNLGALDKLFDLNCIILNSSEYLLNRKPSLMTFYLGEDEFSYEKDKKKAYELLETAVITSLSNHRAKSNADFRDTENAILRAAENQGIKKKKIEENLIVINRYEYDEIYGFSCVMGIKDGNYGLVVKGDPKKIIERCNYINKNGTAVPLKKSTRLRLLNTLDTLSKANQRVVAIAKKTIKSPTDSDTDMRELCRDMVFTGLLGIYIPINTEAAKAVNLCRKNGIDIILMTDENPDSVMGLAKSFSLIDEDDFQGDVNSAYLQRIDKGLFRASLSNYKIFTELLVEEKQEIVKYHNEDGDITAAVSSGLYDTLYQTEADISIIHNEETCASVRQNSDVILFSKNFGVIAECIRHAKGIYYNILHLLQYVMTMQFTLACVIIISLLFENKIIFHPFTLIAFGFLVCLPTGVSIITSKENSMKPSGLSPKLNLGFQRLFLIPFVCGISGGIVPVFSYRFALMTTLSEKAALTGATITLFVFGFLISCSVRTEEYFYKAGLKMGVFGIIAGISTVLALIAAGGFIPANLTMGFLPVGQIPPVLTVLVSVLLGTIPFFISEFLKFIKTKFITAQQR